jgi:hypothetical protein
MELNPGEGHWLGSTPHGVEKSMHGARQSVLA